MGTKSKDRIKPITREVLLKAKQFGFSDRQLSHIWGMSEMAVRQLRIKHGVVPVYKTVDTCAAEFDASTPYHYSSYDRENESIVSDRKKVIILGGGPNRIGQGIEFDYCCVHGVYALEEEGIETIMVNCNPETVSTDYDTTDKLYFEPLTLEDVLSICDHEKPHGVIVSFGGQTPLKIAKGLEANGVNILGTSPEGIDLAEDRERFGALLRKLEIPHPAYGTAYSVSQAVAVAEEIGYPALVRPSYVLGGRAMEICYNSDAVKEYMTKAVDISPEHPVLIDRFLEDAFEYDVDCVSDGTDVMIGGVMEHIEEAGIHSGDSSCVLPPYIISEKNLEVMISYTKKLARALNVVGLMNVQFACKDDTVFVIEVNPRASRTVPFVSKATGIPLAKVAAKVMAGKSLKDLGLADFDFRTIRHISIKEAVFPFNKFPKTPVFLGPEMRSTGEVMGISYDFGASISKAQTSAGNALPKDGGVFISVNDGDKTETIISIARDLISMGFSIIATGGTTSFLQKNGIECSSVFKVGEGRPNVVDRITNGDIQMVINTPIGEVSRYDEFAIGWSALEHKISMFTTLSAASAAVRGIHRQRAESLDVRSIQDYLNASS